MHLLRLKFKQAFYKRSEERNISRLEPITPDSPFIIKGGYSFSATSHVDTSNLAILHFVLSSITTIGSPASIIAEFLAGYFHNNRVLLCKHIPFNLETEEKEREHAKDMKALAEELIEYVFFYI